MGYKKNLHRILYYVTLFTIITPAMLIAAIGHHKDVKEFDHFYFKCNDILNNLKGEYQDIGR